MMNREPDGQPEDGNGDEKVKFANERSTHFYFYARDGGKDASVEAPVMSGLRTADLAELLDS